MPTQPCTAGRRGLLGHLTFGLATEATRRLTDTVLEDLGSA
ncbi:MAG: hypothetical protein WD273_08435 [Trueperaceae bacterium]